MISLSLACFAEEEKQPTDRSEDAAKTRDTERERETMCGWLVVVLSLFRSVKLYSQRWFPSFPQPTTPNLTR